VVTGNLFFFSNDLNALYGNLLSEKNSVPTLQKNTIENQALAKSELGNLAVRNIGLNLRPGVEMSSLNVDFPTPRGDGLESQYAEVLLFSFSGTNDDVRGF
jgi:autonomous glycyl radical cofactor GrcA